jgi:hypothetical protein
MIKYFSKQTNYDLTETSGSGVLVISHTKDCFAVSGEAEAIEAYAATILTSAEITKDEFVALVKDSSYIRRTREALQAMVMSKRSAMALGSGMAHEYVVDCFKNDPALLKMACRLRIDAEVGDVYDLVADLSKRVALQERMLMMFAQKLIDGEAIPGSAVALNYKPFVDQYNAATQSGAIEDRIDVEPDGRPAIFTTLLGRYDRIAKIVKSFYFDPQGA